MKLRSCVFAILACLMISSGTRAQEYSWTVTCSPIDSTGSQYYFFTLDSWGEVCTALGVKYFGDFGSSAISFRSTNGGQTWVEKDSGLLLSTNLPMMVQQVDSLTAFAASDNIYKTTDGGVSWRPIDIQSGSLISSFHFFDAQTGIITKSLSQTDSTDTSNIITTHDGGATWHRARFCPSLSEWTEMCHSYGDSAFCTIGGDYGPIYKTNDDWNTVDSMPLTVPNSDSNLLVVWANFRGQDTIVCYGADHTNNNLLGSPPWMYLIRSTNDGLTWNTPGIPDTSMLAAFTMSSLDRDIVFFGGYRDFSKIYGVSRDHGVTWDIEPYISNTDTVDTWLLSVAVTPKNEAIGIFAPITNFTLGRNSTVLARGVPVNESVSVPISNTGISLYPNPTSGTLTLSGASGDITVTNVLGHIVFREPVPPSSEKISLDLSNLPSGIYYLNAGDFGMKFVKN